MSRPMLGLFQLSVKHISAIQLPAAKRPERETNYSLNLALIPRMNGSVNLHTSISLTPVYLSLFCTAEALIQIMPYNIIKHNIY
jgi:hypothetical protein